MVICSLKVLLLLTGIAGTIALQEAKKEHCTSEVLIGFFGAILIELALLHVAEMFL